MYQSHGLPVSLWFTSLVVPQSCHVLGPVCPSPIICQPMMSPSFHVPVPLCPSPIEYVSLCVLVSLSTSPFMSQFHSESFSLCLNQPRRLIEANSPPTGSLKTPDQTVLSVVCVIDREWTKSFGKVAVKLQPGYASKTCVQTRNTLAD